jgi:hypothetical protein
VVNSFMAREINVTFPAKHSLGSLYSAGRAFPHQRKWLGDAKGSVNLSLEDDKLLGIALGQLGTDGFSSMATEDLAKINSLDFSASYFNDKTAQSASVLADSMPRLLELRFDFLKVSNRELQAANHFHSLQTLWLTGTDLTDELIELVSAQNNIVNLVLKKTRITDGGMTKLKSMPNLQTLNLPSQISDPGLSILAQFPALQRLDVSFTAISDNGLAPLKSLTTLQELYVNDNKLTDAAMPHIAKIGSLTTIFLSGTQISDTGLEHLLEMPLLEHLELRDTRVTEHGISRLRQKMPKCAIFGP